MVARVENGNPRIFEHAGGRVESLAPAGEVGLPGVVQAAGVATMPVNAALAGHVEADQRHAPRAELHRHVHRLKAGVPAIADPAELIEAKHVAPAVDMHEVQIEELRRPRAAGNA